MLKKSLIKSVLIKGTRKCLIKRRKNFNKREKKRKINKRKGKESIIKVNKRK